MNHLVILFLLTRGTLSFGVDLLEKNDPYKWLIDSDKREVKAWVFLQNKLSEKILKKKYKNFQSFRNNTKRALEVSKDFPKVWHIGHYIYQLKKTDQNPKGLLLRALTKKYIQYKSGWQTILNLDSHSKRVGKDYEFSELRCFWPEQRRCMISLNNGGSDKVEQFEYDTKDMAFVKKGFYLPPAKSQIYWINIDTLMVATDWGYENLMAGDYPRQVRMVKRGQNLELAKSIFTTTAHKHEVFLDNPDLSTNIALISEYFSFRDFKVRPFFKGKLYDTLPLPTKGEVLGTRQNRLYYQTKMDWGHNGVSYKEGSIFSFNILNFINKRDFKSSFKLHYSPDEKDIVDWAGLASNGIYINVLKDVKSKLSFLGLSKEKIKRKDVSISDSGAIYLKSIHQGSPHLFFSYVNFDNPSELYEANGLTINKILKEKGLLSKRKIAHRQYFARSHDGIKIPYFVIHKKGMKFNGENPTIIWGYGASSYIPKPFYSNDINLNVIDRGGVYVVANVRGGGEYGKKWNEGGKLLNKKNTFYDFIYIAKDLVKRKITSPKRIGIYGKSWGGLLVTAASSMSPEAFGAVVAEVPMVDMINYKNLGQPGWEGVFGDPENKEYSDYLLSYSPFHQINKKIQYPPTLVIGVTNDERIHPAHSRRFVKKLQDNNGRVLYFEKDRGGHAISTNDDEKATMKAYRWTFLWQHISK